MKLSEIQKTNLLTAAAKVYEGYAALDFFNNYPFVLKNGKSTLKNICRQAIEDQNLDQDIFINNEILNLKISVENQNSYKINFKVEYPNKVSLRKSIIEYNDNEALTLIKQQNFYIDTEDAELNVKNTLSPDIIIGGAGKIDLYRTHLVTLNNIIEKISSNEDISSILIALATGSGKTYVQGLWILVLSLSKNNGIFAVPDKLVPQLYNDLKRLLPNNLINKLQVLRNNNTCHVIENILINLKDPNSPNVIIISSSEQLLDHHYQELLEASPEHTFLSFDEQHLLMKSELRRVRLIELSKRLLSIFLTATPDKETYQLSGNKPVAIMSNGQKQAAGQGQFPVLFTEKARNLSDRNKFYNILNGLLLQFFNSIQPEKSCAAISIVENLPFYLYRKPNETDPRWKIQVPMARKMLCIIDDNETLINFWHALTARSLEEMQKVYHNGNFINRKELASFFGLPNVDDNLVDNDRRLKISNYNANLNKDEKSIIEDLPSRRLLKIQLKRNIFHNMVEYVLKDVTGLDEIEHNRLRKNDLTKFEKLIITKFKVRTAEYYQQKLEKEIDSRGALEISAILKDISYEIFSAIETYKLSQIGYFKNYVNNWTLDKELYDKTMPYSSILKNLFDQYTEKRLIISVMTGMHTSETPIEDSRPFSILKKTSYKMYQNGELVDEVKRRQRTSLEILNDNSDETKFEPIYDDFDEQICDNYFRLGFVGVYISNKKTEGFSDRNLHTVINIAENTLSSTNKPDTLIQGIGRNRGLDETIVPAYIHALGRNQKNMFNFEHLKSDDYYPQLFKAQQSYNQGFIKIIGKTAAEEIIAWYKSNLDIDDTIDHDKLKNQVLGIIAKSLRQLNNNNHHNIQLSRSQLTKVISEVMKVLGQEIDRIQDPYRLSLSVKIISSILNFIFEVYYSFKRIIPALRRLWYYWFGKRSPSQLKDAHAGLKHPDDVYIKIINKTTYKELIANYFILKEFKGWIGRKISAIDTIIRKNSLTLLNDTALKKLTEGKDEFGIYLSKFIHASKREKFLTAIKNLTFDHFIGIWDDLNLVVLESGDNKSIEALILPILQKIPGLNDLSQSDISVTQEVLTDHGIADFTDNYNDFLEDITNFDEEKILTLITDELIPIFFHPQFYKSINKIIGFLDLGDIYVILETACKYHSEDDIRKDADQVMNFMKTIKNKNKKAFKEKFIKPTNGHVYSITTKLPVQTLIDYLLILIQEVINCQCFYNQQEFNGRQNINNTSYYDSFSHNKSSLCDYLSPELRHIHVEAVEDAFFSIISRKTFFMQGIRNGLPKTSQISGESNKAQIKHLQRIKNHILRPLWWTANMSNLGYKIIKLGRIIFFGLRAFGFSIINFCKKVINSIKAGYYKISNRNLISKDYNDTSFDIAKKINELTAFDAKKVMEKDCLTDAVKEIETSISAYQGLNFFASVNKTQEKADNKNQLKLEPSNKIIINIDQVFI